MLDKTKEYQYRNGEKPWRIIWDVPSHKFPISTITEDGDMMSHYADGAYDLIVNDHDLIEVKPKIKGYVNVYPKAKSSADKSFNAISSGLIYATQKHADDAGTNERIACIEIEFEEGDGL